MVVASAEDESLVASSQIRLHPIPSDPGSRESTALHMLSHMHTNRTKICL